MYKRQDRFPSVELVLPRESAVLVGGELHQVAGHRIVNPGILAALGETVEQGAQPLPGGCLLYTSDAADERPSVDLGGRRIIKQKNKKNKKHTRHMN